VTTLAIHLLSSRYESTHVLILIGFLVMIIGLLWGYGEPESDHFYAKELPSASYGAMTVSVVFAIFCAIVGIGGSLATGNPWYLVAIFGTMVFAIVVVMLRKEKNRFDFEDMMTPDTYECPNCGHKVGRFERSCVGCGAVVWTVFHPGSDASYRIPPGNKVPRGFKKAKPGKTWRV